MSKKLYTTTTTKAQLRAIIDELTTQLSKEQSEYFDLQAENTHLEDTITELQKEKLVLMSQINDLMAGDNRPKPVVNDIHSALVEKSWSQDNADGTIWSKRYKDYRVQGNDQQQVRAYLKRQGKKFTTTMDGLQTKLIIHQ